MAEFVPMEELIRLRRKRPLNTQGGTALPPLGNTIFSADWAAGGNEGQTTTPPMQQGQPSVPSVPATPAGATAMPPLGDNIFTASTASTASTWTQPGDAVNKSVWDTYQGHTKQVTTGDIGSRGTYKLFNNPETHKSEWIKDPGRTVQLGLSGTRGGISDRSSLADSQKTIRDQLGAYLSSRIGQGVAAYEGPSWDPATTEDYLQSQYDLANAQFEDTVVPEIAAAYRGPGTYWGGARAHALQDARSDFELQQTAMAAQVRFEAQDRFVQQNYDEWWRTLPETNPVLAQALDFLGIPMINTIVQQSSSSGGSSDLFGQVQDLFNQFTTSQAPGQQQSAPATSQNSAQLGGVW